MGNSNLHNAKTNKNDEFYTQYEDIQEELNNSGYLKEFYGKTIYCNCDDPEWSNFWNYFKIRFNDFKLKSLISTHYEQDENKSSYMLRYDGKNTIKEELAGNGDFRSEECIELLKEADVVVTNPPFSLFREYVAQLMEYNKKFVIIGNKNAITYKEFFPLLKDNKVWIGYNSPSKFGQPDTDKPKNMNGLTRWFTNIDIDKRHKELNLTCRYNEEDYPKYDNYDAINIDKVSEIPEDYYGVMGVPITFLDKYNPAQFEIIGLGTTRELYTPTKTYINPKKYFKDGRIISANEINSTLTYPISKEQIDKVYYKADNCDKILFQPYARLLIKKVF